MANYAKVHNLYNILANIENVAERHLRDLEDSHLSNITWLSEIAPATRLHLQKSHHLGLPTTPSVRSRRAKVKTNIKDVFEIPPQSQEKENLDNSMTRRTRTTRGQPQNKTEITATPITASCSEEGIVPSTTRRNGRARKKVSVESNTTVDSLNETASSISTDRDSDFSVVLSEVSDEDVVPSRARRTRRQVASKAPVASVVESSQSTNAIANEQKESKNETHAEVVENPTAQKGRRGRGAKAVASSTCNTQNPQQETANQVATSAQPTRKPRGRGKATTIKANADDVIMSTEIPSENAEPTTTATSDALLNPTSSTQAAPKGRGARGGKGKKQQTQATQQNDEMSSLKENASRDDDDDDSNVSAKQKRQENMHRDSVESGESMSHIQGQSRSESESASTFASVKNGDNVEAKDAISARSAHAAKTTTLYNTNSAEAVAQLAFAAAAIVAEKKRKSDASSGTSEDKRSKQQIPMDKTQSPGWTRNSEALAWKTLIDEKATRSTESLTQTASNASDKLPIETVAKDNLGRSDSSHSDSSAHRSQLPATTPSRIQNADIAPMTSERNPLTLSSTAKTKHLLSQMRKEMGVSQDAELSTPARPAANVSRFLGAISSPTPSSAVSASRVRTESASSSSATKMDQRDFNSKPHSSGSNPSQTADAASNQALGVVEHQQTNSTIAHRVDSQASKQTLAVIDPANSHATSNTTADADESMSVYESAESGSSDVEEESPSMLCNDSQVDLPVPSATTSTSTSQGNTNPISYPLSAFIHSVPTNISNALSSVLSKMDPQTTRKISPTRSKAFEKAEMARLEAEKKAEEKRKMQEALLESAAQQRSRLEEELQKAREAQRVQKERMQAEEERVKALAEKLDISIKQQKSNNEKLTDRSIDYKTRIYQETDDLKRRIDTLIHLRENRSQGLKKTDDGSKMNTSITNSLNLSQIVSPRYMNTSTTLPTVPSDAMIATNPASSPLLPTQPLLSAATTPSSHLTSDAFKPSTTTSQTTLPLPTTTNIRPEILIPTQQSSTTTAISSIQAANHFAPTTTPSHHETQTRSGSPVPANFHQEGAKTSLSHQIPASPGRAAFVKPLPMTPTDASTPRRAALRTNTLTSPLRLPQTPHTDLPSANYQINPELSKPTTPKSERTSSSDGYQYPIAGYNPDDDEDEKRGKPRVPKWAESPEILRCLRYENRDPDLIFLAEFTPAEVNLEEIFGAPTTNTKKYVYSKR